MAAMAMRAGGSHLRSTLGIGISGVDPVEEMLHGVLEHRGIEFIENAQVPITGPRASPNVRTTTTTKKH
jgi:hypothetical protein